MEFNKKHFRELLQYSQSLKKQNRKLEPDKVLQLLTYSATLCQQLDWEMKDMYSTLMAQYLNGEISESRFKLEFVLLQKSQDEVQNVLESNLVILTPSSNPNFEKVSNLISDLASIIEEFALESNFTLKELQELANQNKYSEAEKRKKLQNYELVKEIYSELQMCLEDSPGLN